MLMNLTHPSIDTIWQNGLKRKIQQSVAYRKCISSTETRASLGSKARRFTKPMAPKNWQE
jgi:hypothetical protein